MSGAHSPEHLLFLTGRLAEPNLARILERMDAQGFTYEVRALGIKVAALMTTDFIQRRLEDTGGADRVVLPGYCRGRLEELEERYGVPFVRGPEDLKDLPEFLGHGGIPPDLSGYAVTIVGEIVDAPHLSVEGILERAAYFRREGADIIDLGCLPGTDFPHLEDGVRALKEAGYRVSVDSLNEQELRRGGLAGADLLLSLSERTLHLADEVEATPVVIPDREGDLDSLLRSVDALESRGHACIADPVLDPIHFGFAESVHRFREFRRQRPEAPMMMGIGNVTELTDADTTGINALLLGLCSELDIRHVLATEVSRHARTALREADTARRMMYAAKQDGDLPRGYTDGLLAHRDKRPFPYTLAELQGMAEQVRDPNFRVHVTEEGIHAFNRDGFHSHRDPLELYPELDLENDAAHAFYMGVELARAEIAWQLGKRYAQDEPLRWGDLVDRAEDTDEDKLAFREVSGTLRERKDRKDPEKSRKAGKRSAPRHGGKGND